MVELREAVDFLNSRCSNLCGNSLSDLGRNAEDRRVIESPDSDTWAFVSDSSAVPGDPGDDVWEL